MPALLEEKPNALVPAILALDPLGDDLRVAILVAAEAGFSGVALSVRHPTLAALRTSLTARRHLRHTLASRGLKLACLRCSVPRANGCGIFDSAGVDRCIDEVTAAICLAWEFQAPLVEAYIGEPHSPALPAASFHGAVDALAREADRAGVRVVLASGAVRLLADLLSLVNVPCLQANLDTLRLFTADGGVEESANILAGKIGLWTCADVIRIGGSIRTVELGTGQAHPEKILAVLRNQEFTGPILIDVRDLPDPIHAAHRAAAVLRGIMRRS